MESPSTPCTLSHTNFASQKQSRNRIFACDTLSHNFPFYMIPSRIIFLSITIPCRIIFSAKGHPVERHIPSGQILEYPPPWGGKDQLDHLTAIRWSRKIFRNIQTDIKNHINTAEKRKFWHQRGNEERTNQHIAATDREKIFPLH